jgi:DNA polymerase-3 subunit alpha
MIRKAVAKKIQRLMDKHKRMFTKGAVERGIDAEIAEQVWADIEFFARYGFNRAHATDYAVITGQTAYLKAHYPLEFMTALMTTERHNTEKLGFLIMDARRNSLDVEGPSLNHSNVECTVEHDADDRRFIRIGLGAIKNVGDEAMRMVVEARDSSGPFKSLDDFADRVDLRRLNRKALECMVQAGAFDEFGKRPAMMTLIDTLMGVSAQIHGARDVGQITLFDNMTEMRQAIEPPAFVPPIPDRQMLEWERELLGTYLSNHPLSQHEQKLLAQELITTTIGHHTTETAGQVLKLVGMVQRVRRIITKRGDPMAFVTLEGSGGTIDVVVFPRTYKRFRDKLVDNRILVVSGKLDSRPNRDDHPLLAEWFKEPHEFLVSSETNNGGRSGSDGGNGERAPSRSGAVATSKRTRGNGNGGAASSATQAVSTSRGDAQRASPQATVQRATSESPTPHEGNGRDEAVEDRQSVAPPPEPPLPPATVYITLRRSGDNRTDFEKLSNVHRMLKSAEGPDQFVVILEGAQQKIELSFPNEYTHFTPVLRQQLATIVGAENLRVVQQQISPW